MTDHYSSVPCGPGSYRQGDMQHCEQCPGVNDYSNRGASSCQSCSAGSVSNSDKSACGKIIFLDLDMALGYSSSNVKQDAKK